MTTTRATATIYRASIESLGGYGIEAYGDTEEQAMTLLGKAARKFAKQCSFSLERNWAEYYGANVYPISIGHGYVKGSDSPII
jgi:hypothetical protein